MIQNPQTEIVKNSKLKFWTNSKTQILTRKVFWEEQLDTSTTHEMFSWQRFAISQCFEETPTGPIYILSALAYWLQGLVFLVYSVLPIYIGENDKVFCLLEYR